MTPSRLSRELADALYARRRTGPQLAWMHPSMRDLLITYLMEHDAERRGFIQRSGLDGFLLAISSAGGAGGERELPLMRDDGDWKLLQDRAARIPSEISVADMSALLNSLRNSVNQLRAAQSPLAARLERIADRAVRASRERIDAERAAIPLSLLRSFVRLTSELSPLLPMPDLMPTWEEVAPEPNVLTDLSASDIRDYESFLAFVGIISNSEPRLLAQLEFSETFRIFYEQLLDTAEAFLAGLATLDESESDPYGQLLPGEDPDDIDFSAEEEDESATLEAIADAIRAAGTTWSLFGLHERADEVASASSAQAQIRSERVEAVAAMNRPEPDDDDRSYGSYRPETFSIKALFSDL
jgi:hypothetical protein